MPTQTLTTSTDVALALRTTYTTPLLTKIAAGSKIYATDVVMLKDFANEVINHTHTLTEYTQYNDYGDAIVGNIAVNTSTTLPNVGANVVFTDTVLTGNSIKASTYNALNIQANNFISHTHNFSDTY